MEYPKSDYKEYPKTLDPDDIWGQVRRTAYGKPIPEDQILLMVAAMRSGLELAAGDVLLDIGCGNGALSHYLFPDCSGYLGVDFSEYLVSVGQRKFHRPGFDFHFSDALEYLRGEPDPKRFNKAMCFAVLSYMNDDTALDVLTTLRKRFANVTRVFLGNLPDRDLAGQFYPADVDYSRDIEDPASQIGRWRNPEQMAALAEEAGWRLSASRMPDHFYQSHYRYNAVLEILE
ncbi:class I SAM-dependent methyltransferase [Chromobacterium sp. ASV23]|uniref:class I SAM-dependent methyltransferase n=1 Tax=Chromobacterium sp. ASV23 TaxID=2795110 RepID=UPI0018EDD1FC|nr:class I SAM-dependent methyltransferase [Chromobacterium sp. ASV23]